MNEEIYQRVVQTNGGSPAAVLQAMRDLRQAGVKPGNFQLVFCESLSEAGFPTVWMVRVRRL